MEFLDPRSAASTPPDPYELSTPLGAGSTVGLFANGFPDSVNFLSHVEKALAARLPGVGFRSADKGNASRTGSAEEIRELSEACDAVVAAYGH